MSEYLFAYGTLQPGYAPVEMAALVAKMQPVGAGSVPGILYDFGDYPGAILDPASVRKIAGTVLKIPDDGNLLRELDDYEGFYPNSPNESLFIRISHPVELAAGGTLLCWVYIYNGNPDRARIVESGTYAWKSF